MGWLQKWLEQLLRRLNPKPPQPPPINLTEIQAELARQLNIQRAIKRLPPYTNNMDLTDAAQKHCQYMADNSIMSHTGQGGSNFLQRIRAEGYNGQPVSEIIAANFATPESVVKDGWMKSDVGHKEAVLHPTADHCGLGYARNAKGVNYWCVTIGDAQFTQGMLVIDLPEPIWGDGE